MVVAIANLPGVPRHKARNCRTPSTLQSLEQQSIGTARNEEHSAEKWDEIKREIEGRKTREEQERREFVREAEESRKLQN